MIARRLRLLVALLAVTASSASAQGIGYWKGLTAPTFGSAGVAASTCAAPGIYLTTAPTNGIAFTATPSVIICVNGSAVVTTTSSAVTSGVPLTINVNGGATLIDDAANTLALRNGIATQEFRVGPAAAYLMLNKVNGSNGRIGTFDATTLLFATNDTNRWYIGNTTGHFLAATDNTYDIGASGATRPRNIFAAGEMIASTGMYPGEYAIMNSGGRFSWSGRGNMYAAADGVIQLTNIAATGFNRLILGTNNTSGVALQKNSAELNVVYGDGSDFRPINASSFKLQGPSTGFGSTSTTGTLVTNDAQTVAVNGVISLGTNATLGNITIIDGTDGNVALFAIRGANGLTAEISDPTGAFSVTAGTANSFNIYWSAGNARYELQNLRGYSASIRLIRQGI